jgi:hypothetical protein
MRRRIVSSIVSFALSLSLLTAVSIVTAPPANANVVGTGSGLFALLKNGAETYASIPTDMKFSDRCGSTILTTVDFDWSTTMPTGTSCGTLSGSLRTNYSAMITGYLLAPVTGNYTFKSRNDDGFVVNEAVEFKAVCGTMTSDSAYADTIATVTMNAIEDMVAGVAKTIGGNTNGLTVEVLVDDVKVGDATVDEEAGTWSFSNSTYSYVAYIPENW